MTNTQGFLHGCLSTVSLKEAKHTLKGSLLQGSQFHLTMEPISCRVEPVEDGYDVYATTQWPTECQAVISKVLSEPANRYWNYTKENSKG